MPKVDILLVTYAAVIARMNLVIGVTCALTFCGIDMV